MKTIKQLSAELGISKEAIYKKLKFQLKDQLSGHVRKIDKITRIDEEGELIIRRSLHRERREAIETVMETVVEDGALFEPEQKHLTEYVELLREQIRTKDVQIETQSGHIGQLIRQLGVAQFLPHPGRLRELQETKRDAEQAKPPANEGEESSKPKKSRGSGGWSKIFSRRKITPRF